MATAGLFTRNPLATRPQLHDTGMSISPCRSTLRKPSTAKRALSPEPAADGRDHSSKRVRTSASRAPVVEESPTPAAAARAEEKRERAKQKAKDRLDREEDFKNKYSRAFPNWTFYFDFDLDNPETVSTRNHLEKRLNYMGARADKFFSKSITHFITLHDVDDKENKEKASSRRTSSATPAPALGSPITLRGRVAVGGSLLDKARQFGMKIWSANKLHTILDRCDVPRASGSNAALPARPEHLATLLKSERLHGTMERDPTQPRNDFKYFSKDSYFVLVEDMRQELATITATEYPITRGKDGKETPAWPVLYCHPLARGPFLPYDEREERRRQKAERAEKERIEDRARRKARLQQHERKRRIEQQLRQKAAAAAAHDLRKSASLNNLRRRATFPEGVVGVVDTAAGGVDSGFVDLDADFTEETQSVHASGYLASGAYMAASGNSMSIASTAGTTSTVGVGGRDVSLPPGLREKMLSQVTMSRRASAAAAANKENVMGPPPTIPERAKLLRKSKSMTTLRLPKRDEASKPGYCECCRTKFEDFREHIVSRRHRKFALHDANFDKLDLCLAQVRRRTRAEAEEAEALFLEEAYAQTTPEQPEGEEDASTLAQLGSEEAGGDDDGDVRWEDWVASEA